MGVMTALDAYKKYRIYIGLQKHQLRVAAVARAVALSARETVDVELVTTVGLFHDMGNIIKANLPRYQEFLVPEGLAYWEEVQRDFIARYGHDEHVATEAICRDMGLSEHVVDIVESMRFSRTQAIRDFGTLEQKICKYADLRVSPWGIVPMRERLAEARERYAGNPMDGNERYSPEELAEGARVCDDIEAQLVARCSFKPEDITDAAMAPVIEQLKEYRVL